jgi:hypothetical protein
MAYEVNKTDLASLLQLQLTAALNTSQLVGKDCNSKLLEANTFGNLVKRGTVMGGVEPSLFGSKKQTKKWGTAVTEIRKRGPLDLSMTRTADMANLGTVTRSLPMQKMPPIRMAASQDAGREHELQDTELDLQDTEFQQVQMAALGPPIIVNQGMVNDTGVATELPPASTTSNTPTVGDKEKATELHQGSNTRKAAATAEATELPPASSTSKTPTVGDKEKATELPQGSNTTEARDFPPKAPTTAEDATHVPQSVSASSQNSTPAHGTKRKGMEGRPGHSADLVDTPEQQATELPAASSTSKTPTVRDKEKATELPQGSNTAEARDFPPKAPTTAEDAADVLPKAPTTTEDAADFPPKAPTTAEVATDVQQSVSASSQNSTPTHGTKRKGMEGLVDTPEQQCPGTRAGRLKKNQTRPSKKANLPPPEPSKKGDHPPWVDWTDEEGMETEYGISRITLKVHGITKAHLDNLKDVMSTYPALKKVVQHNMDQIKLSYGDNAHAGWAEQVADEVRGVHHYERWVLSNLHRKNSGGGKKGHRR